MKMCCSSYEDLRVVILLAALDANAERCDKYCDEDPANNDCRQLRKFNMVPLVAGTTAVRRLHQGSPLDQSGHCHQQPFGAHFTKLKDQLENSTNGRNMRNHRH